MAWFDLQKKLICWTLFVIMTLPCAAFAQEQTVQWHPLADIDRVYETLAEAETGNADLALARRLLAGEAWRMETRHCFETPSQADLFIARVALDDNGAQAVLLLIRNEENSWGDDLFTLTVWREAADDWRLVGVAKARMDAVTLQRNPNAAFYNIETGVETMRWDGAGYVPRLRLVSALSDRKGREVRLRVPTVAEKKLVERSFMDAYRQAVRESAVGVTAYALKIAEVNLDDRDAKEVLVVIDSPLFCGTAGCELTIWQKRNGHWRDIGEGTVPVLQDSQSVMLLDNKTAGYHDLTIGCSRHVWSGSSY